MKVVFFVHRYWPSIGGVEKYVHELAKTLTAAGHEVNMVAGTVAGDSPEEETFEGIRIHRFPAHRSPLRARYWFWRNLHLFHEADVVQVSNTHMLEYLWRMLGQRLDGGKVFLTRHGMSYRYPVPDSEKRRASRSMQLAAGFVHDGTYIQKWLGVRPDICPDQGLSPEAHRLKVVPEPPPNSAIFIGRLEPDSGIHLYLDAVRVLTKEERRPFVLDVYGDGSLAAVLQEEVNRLALSVRFHGRIPTAQDHISDACFAFVDGRMAIQEAMARRRLVCTAFVNPLKQDYVCGESFSSYLAAAGRGSELAAIVAENIDRPELRCAMVERAYQFAATLSWRRTAAAYLGLWTERLQRTGSVLEAVGTDDLLVQLRREARLPKESWALT